MKSVTKSPRTEILRIVTLRYKLIVRNWKISTTTVLQRCVYAWSLTLDLQDGGVVIKNGQNDFVHVLPQTQVYLLLLLQSIDQLRARQRERKRKRKRKRRERERERERKSEMHQMSGNFKTSAVHQSTSNRLTSSLDALSISAARHWALVWQENRFLASYKLRLRIWALRSSFWSRSLWFS